MLGLKLNHVSKRGHWWTSLIEESLSHTAAAENKISLIENFVITGGTVVVMTTYRALNDDNAVKLTIFFSVSLQLFQWRLSRQSVNFNYGLTYWGREKMAAILQTVFQVQFLQWKSPCFDYTFTEICPESPVNNQLALV